MRIRLERFSKAKRRASWTGDEAREIRCDATENVVAASEISATIWIIGSRPSPWWLLRSSSIRKAILVFLSSLPPAVDSHGAPVQSGSRLSTPKCF